MPNKLSISGHTDSVPYRSDNGYTNWELSSRTAPTPPAACCWIWLGQERVANVQGRAATEATCVPEDTTHESNRRISIVLLRENTVPARH